MKDENFKKKLAVFLEDPAVAKFIAQVESTEKYGDILDALLKFSKNERGIDLNNVILNKVDRYLESKTPELAREIVPKKGKDYFTREEIVGFLEAASPKKGKDYFTDQEVKDLVSLIVPLSTPIKGKDYFTDGEIKDFLRKATPIKGKDYFDGEPGYTPIKGIDYFDGEPGKDALEITPENIADKLNTLNKAVDVSVINGIEELIKKNTKTSTKLHGGGVSVLSQLKDVSLGTLSNNDVLKYNSTTGRWENGTGGGGSPVAVYDEGVLLTSGVTSFDFVGAGVVASTVGNAVTVTIAGGGGVSGSGTLNKIPLWTPNGTTLGDSDFESSALTMTLLTKDLKVSSGVIQLSTGVQLINSSGNLTLGGGYLVPTAGGTGFTGYTAGDILYADTTTTLAKLAIGGNNTFLGVNGSGVLGYYAGNAGTVTSVGITAGNLIDVSGSPITTSGNITVDVDLSELATSTTDADGDYFAVIDSTNAQYKLTKANINLSGFNNDSGWTSNTGTVTNIATAGLISGGAITTTGTITTSMATNKLVGRGTAGTGIMEEITLGTNLSLTGTTLNAASPTGAALTKVDDTNVTLTLAGSPSTALLNAASITVGWTGTLADGRIASASTWNAKQAALSGTGIVKSTAGTISYISGTSGQFVKGDGSLDSSTYLTSVGTGVANELTYWSGANTLGSLATATYPSLTELSYVKGVTSAIQTQINGKQPLDTQLTSLAGLSYTGNALKYIRVNAGETDFELATVSGSGTVTNTGGNLTANSVVLGAGSADVKVVAGIVTDGVSQLTLGVNATTLGKLKMFGNTSGDVTVQPAAVAGTATVQTLPATTGTLVNRVTTANGVSASNSDGALTFTLGAITPSSAVVSGTTTSNALNLGTQVVATAAGTTTLTSASVYQTIFTGALTQIIVLPDATTLSVGHRYKVSNQSTGAVTLQTNGGAILWQIAAATDIDIVCQTNAIAAGTWDLTYDGHNITTGKVLTVGNTITLNGTDGTTMTLPATSATLYGSVDAIPAANVPNGITTLRSALFTQSMTAGTYYYVPDSALTMPATSKTGGGMSTSTTMQWQFMMRKTAAGTGAFNVRIYRGTNGTTADTADVTQSIGTATAAVDIAYVIVTLKVTATGGTGSYTWGISVMHKAATGVGFGTTDATPFWEGTVSSVAMNTASLKFGIGIMGTTGTTALVLSGLTGQVNNMN